MKLTYNPRPDYTFLLEGTPEEIHDFVEIMVGSSNRSASPLAPVQVIEPKRTSTKIKSSSNVTPVDINNNFLRSVFVYEPNSASKSGRGAWIAQQILKGNTLNLHRLAASAHASTTTVRRAIDRMIEAGAQLEVTATNVRLISIPEPPYTPRYKSNRKPRPNEAKTNATSSTSINRAANLMDALKSMKVD